MITGTEMAVVDRNAVALGVPETNLKESAGSAVARAVRDLASEGSIATTDQPS